MDTAGYANLEIFADMRGWCHGQLLIEADLNVWNYGNGEAGPYGENSKNHRLNGAEKWQISNRTFNPRIRRWEILTGVE